MKLIAENLVDGVDIREMSRKELRSRFGMVLQDTWLFEGTIAENIGYAEKHAAGNCDPVQSRRVLIAL